MVNRWEGSRTLDTDTACYQDITVEAAHHSWTSSAWFYSTSLQDGDQSTHQSTSDRRTSQYSGLDEPPSDHGHPPPAPPLQSGHQVKTDSPVLYLQLKFQSKSRSKFWSGSEADISEKYFDTARYFNQIEMETK